MKRLLLALSVASMLFSCKKENKENVQPTPSTEKKQAIRLSIADFLVTEGQLSRRSDASQFGRQDDSAKISDIYYLAFRSSTGTRASFIHQDTLSTPAGFGTISDSLAPGVYTIVLIASEKVLYTESFTHSQDTNITAHYFGPELYGIGVNPMGDAFYKKFQMEVLPSGNISSLEVSLDRIVGKLEVNILDALPQSDPNGFTSVKVTPAPMFYYVAYDSVAVPASNWEWFGTRINQTRFSDYIIGSNYEFNVDIIYKDKITGETLTKTIEHVKCNKNKKTIISGYVYGHPANPGGPDYQIKLNQAWDSDSTIINF